MPDLEPLEPEMPNVVTIQPVRGFDSPTAGHIIRIGHKCRTYELDHLPRVAIRAVEHYIQHIGLP